MKEKKYFALISEAHLHQAPKTKVLPKAALSDLLTSQELLERIKQEAEEYRKKVIAESEELKTAAQREGFELGYNQWVKQLKCLEDEIAKVRDEVSKFVMPIAVKAAKKIVSQELETSKQAILNIVMNTIKAVAQHKRVVIYVSKQDYSFIESSKGTIKQLFEAVESLSIRERADIEPGGCVIETEAGIINAQLKDRWKTLEAAFESLAFSLGKLQTGDQNVKAAK